VKKERFWGRFVQKGRITLVSPKNLGGFDAKQNQGGTLLYREIHLSSNFISSIEFNASLYHGCDSINDCAFIDSSCIPRLLHLFAIRPCARPDPLKSRTLSRRRQVTQFIMVPVIGLSHITNPLATPDQLQTTASQLDRIPADLGTSIKFEGSRLIQAAGILLHLPQELVAEAIIIFSRFWLGPEGGSLAEYAAKVCMLKDGGPDVVTGWSTAMSWLSSQCSSLCSGPCPSRRRSWSENRRVGFMLNIHNIVSSCHQSHSH
jgi:hypothetical protein